MLHEKHNAHCKEIVETMEKYNDGYMYNYEGEDIYIDNDMIMEDDEGEYIIIEDEKVYLEDLEPLSLYDYFNTDGIYNIDYVINGYKEYQAVRLMVACGGPNIYINTWDKKVELFWWSESGEAYIPYELNDAINDIWEEYYNCL